MNIGIVIPGIELGPFAVSRKTRMLMAQNILFVYLDTNFTSNMKIIVATIKGSVDAITTATSVIGPSSGIIISSEKYPSHVKLKTIRH